jgi:hypothetical protein
VVGILWFILVLYVLYFKDRYLWTVHEKAGLIINKFAGLILFFLYIFTCTWIHIILHAHERDRERERERERENYCWKELHIPFYLLMAKSDCFSHEEVTHEFSFKIVN